MNELILILIWLFLVAALLFFNYCCHINGSGQNYRKPKDKSK